jgi:hypothetical protein
VFGGLEPLHRYNPHKTEGFLIMKALQSRYRGVTGVTNAARLRAQPQQGMGNTVQKQGFYYEIWGNGSPERGRIWGYAALFCIIAPFPPKRCDN